jgi:hypothetical protein
MFRCDNCGSGYSTQAASSWTCCPRCLAKDRVQVPLTFELGWKGRPGQREESEAQRSDSLAEAGGEDGRTVFS